jgi:hypothetical protein
VKRELEHGWCCSLNPKGKASFKPDNLLKRYDLGVDKNKLDIKREVSRKLNFRIFWTR